jgi:hypothetical protein
MKDSSSSVGPRTSRAHVFELKTLVMKTSARDVRGPTEELESFIASSY